MEMGDRWMGMGHRRKESNDTEKRYIARYICRWEHIVCVCVCVLVDTRHPISRLNQNWLCWIQKNPFSFSVSYDNIRAHTHTHSAAPATLYDIAIQNIIGQKMNSPFCSSHIHHITSRHISHCRVGVVGEMRTTEYNLHKHPNKWSKR